jgi:hypothetical protein
VLTAVQDLSEAARELKGLARTASGMLAEKGPGRVMLEDLAAVSSQLRKDLPAITGKAQQAADGAAAVAGAFTAEDGQKLKEAIARYEKAGAQLNDVASRAEKLLGRIEAGEGHDRRDGERPAVYQDLKTLVTDLKKHPWKVLLEGLRGLQAPGPRLRASPGSGRLRLRAAGGSRHRASGRLQAQCPRLHARLQAPGNAPDASRAGPVRDLPI